MELFDVYPLFDIAIERGQGCHVWDDKGQEYLDLYGGHAVISVGHAHPHYVEAISSQVAKLGFYSNSVQNPLQKELASALGKACGYEDYQRQRLIAPYAPDTVDPEGYGITWQTNQSKAALASGRLTGVGYGQGIKTQSSVLPAKHTDCIFASIGEEMGMIVCILIIVLLTVIIIRCCVVRVRSGSTFGMLICFGVAAALAFQTFINIGMCIGITPVIGITLPFISYGGSSVVTLFAAVGLVSGVKFRPKPQRYMISI